jgi:hypothetical protein
MYYSIAQLAKATLTFGTTIYDVFEHKSMYRRYPLRSKLRYTSEPCFFSSNSSLNRHMIHQNGNL